jgi:sphinganine-1-phosphate aldolase
MTADEVRARLQELRKDDLPTHGGRTLAYVFDAGRPEVDALARETVAAFAATNGLDPTAFKSVAIMERELVAFTAGLLRAPEGFAGTVTSGGTESCLLAVLAARDARPDVARPQVVAPTTVHAAFHKAAHLFGLELTLVDVDPGTQKADPAAIEAALTDRTVLVVVSAPSYAHGVVDPVEPVAAAAAARGIRCHVDACIGGFVLPFLDDAPTWDFAAEGVTSISADMHKYGYAPKGASVLVHRSLELRHSQWFAEAGWPGYGIVNSTLQSTKSAGPLAAAWAVAQLLGHDGYAELAQQARAGTLEVAAGAQRIDGLRVLAQPDSTLLAIGTDGSCDVFTIIDELKARDWLAQPQLPFRGGPASLHLSLSAATAPKAAEFLTALREATAAAQARGPETVDAALAEGLDAVDPALFGGPDADQAFAALAAAAGIGGDGDSVQMPDRMAPVNAILAAAPVPLREALLIAVLERT